MSPKPTNRIVRAVTDRLRARDRLQMRVADALLSVVEPKRASRKRPPRKRLAKQPR